ncbi:MAG: hypothetical protein HYV07_05895 [Deltaproteobacteria bacterium]|nr:hypothetical protein [Deltaproteobacteria bacterium]
MQGARRRKAALALTLASIGGACDEDRALIEIPGAEGLSSFISAIRKTDASFDFTAHHADDRWLVKDTQELLLMGYVGELAEYGLSAGPVVPQSGACALQSPAVAFQRDPFSRSLRPLQDPPSLAETLVGPDCIRCTRVSATWVDLELDEKVLSALELTPDQVLLSTDLPRLAILGTTSAQTLAGCAWAASGLLGSPGGGVWVVHDAVLDLVTLTSTSCASRRSVPLPGPAKTAAAVPSSNPLELYVVLEDRRIVRFLEDQHSAEVILTIEGAELDFRDPGLIALGPSEILFHPSTQSVFRWASGTLERSEIAVDSPLRSGLDALAYSPRFGRLAGDLIGNVHAFDETSTAWRRLIATGAPRAVGSILSYRDGLILIVDGGRFYKWSPHGGLCPEQPIARELDGGSEIAFVSGNRIVLPDIVGGTDGTRGAATWLVDE